MRHPALFALTAAELGIFDLPPLTEAEEKVLGPRHGCHAGMRITPLDGFSLPEGAKHTCAEQGHVPCPACTAVEEEIERRKAL